MSKAFFLTLTLCLIAPGPALAQRPDRPGSADHPLVSRFEGSTIDKYEEYQFDRYALPLGPGTAPKTLGEVEALEGRVTKINYAFWEDPKPSLFQLYKSYEGVLKSGSAEILFSCIEEECAGDGEDLVRAAADSKMLLNGFMAFGDHAYLAARVAEGDKTTYIAIYLKQERANVAYELHFIEVEAMDTDMVTMADITAGIDLEGKQAFYGLYFETGSANLKESSQGELALLAEYLAANSDAAYFIVGHTDNVGTYASNRFLAKARAQSVITALEKDFGLDTSSLTPVGIGPVSPVASNAAESGRARNRRVELVLK